MVPNDITDNPSVNRLLMIAFHYPPFRGSSGLQRTLSFSRDLPAQGWAPVVLTAIPRAYPNIGDDQLGDIPESVPLQRVFAVDTTRHLAFNGRYSKYMALPDQWVTWFISAVPAGLLLVRKYRPKVIWSTYPIATAHLIGLALHRLTGIPWIADFRDPMIELDPKTNQRYPTDPALWRARRWIEQQSARHSSRMVFVTPGACRMHVERYPELAADRLAVIANGFDEAAFTQAERLAVDRPPYSQRIVLLHSGTLYPTIDRDPSVFFNALANLRQAGKIATADIEVRLRATGYDDYYRQLIKRKGLEEIVTLAPPIPYREALAEMLHADGLLIFQGYTSNPAIPAKLYEYFRAHRPIFALVDPEGDTAQTLRAAKIGTLVPLDSEPAITSGLLEFIEMVKTKRAPVLDPATMQTHSREYRARELATLLDMFVS